MIDKDLITRICNQADIVTVVSHYLKVSKKGKNYVALCPFHNDTNPSLLLNVEMNTYACFVCNSFGNAINFVEKYEHLGFIDALKKVASIINFHDPQLDNFKASTSSVKSTYEPLYKCLKDLNSYYEYSLFLNENKDALDYLYKRGMTKEIISKFHIGYAPKDGFKTIEVLKSKGHSINTIDELKLATLKNDKLFDSNSDRIVFPITNADGKIIAFSARKYNANDLGPKYVNSSESKVFHKSQTLYNLFNAKEAAKINKKIFIVEGFMDAISLSKINYNNAVTLMGVNLSEDHIKVLSSLNVPLFFCLDGDKPGQEATFNHLNKLFSIIDDCYVINVNSKFKDADEIYQNLGPDGLKNYLNNYVSAFEFLLNYYKNNNKLLTSEDKTSFVKKYLPLIKNVKDDLLKKEFLNKISSISNISEKTLKEYLVEINKTSNKNIDLSNILKNDHSFKPTNRQTTKLERNERCIIYHLLNNKDARIYFDNLNFDFYTDTCRKLFNFIMELSSNDEDNFSINALLGFISSSNPDDKEKYINEINKILNEKEFYYNYSNKLMDDCIKNINEETEKINKLKQLFQDLDGKDDPTKAKIINKKYEI